MGLGCKKWIHLSVMMPSLYARKSIRMYLSGTELYLLQWKSHPRSNARRKRLPELRRMLSEMPRMLLSGLKL
jgi:hypothetical protein